MTCKHLRFDKCDILNCSSPLNFHSSLTRTTAASIANSECTRKNIRIGSRADVEIARRKGGYRFAAGSVVVEEKHLARAPRVVYFPAGWVENSCGASLPLLSYWLTWGAGYLPHTAKGSRSNRGDATCPPCRGLIVGVAVIGAALVFELD